MDVKRLIDQLRSTVENARSMPMSSSAVINKAELLGRIEALEAALPGAFEESGRVFSERDGVVADARDQADSIVHEATRERDRLVSDSEVVRAGQQEVDQLRLDVERECQALRRETDEYVDGRLANLEISLTKTLEAVNRGRERLHGRSELDQLDSSDEGEGFAFPG